MKFPRYSHLQCPSLDDFIEQQKLGEGTYGSVSKYIHKQTKIPYAIKKMSLKDKQKKDLLMIQKQMQILYKMKNKYIVELVDHIEDCQKNQIFLIMEYIEGKDLHKSVFTKKVKLPEPQVASIVYQIGVALVELHKNKVIHRDLKLQNVIYLPNKSIKLVDMGCSNYYGEDIQRLTSIGTKFYFSPQLLSGDGQDDKLDIWCWGVLLYELLFLTSPFKGNDMFLKIRKIQYEIPQSHRNDLQLIDLFKKVFCYKPKRLRANQVIQHPWIQRFYPQKPFQSNIQSQLIDKQQLKRYKEFLLEHIAKCENDIQKFKEDNRALTSQLARLND